MLESQLDKKDEGFECGSLSLRRLLVWLEQPCERLKYLNIVCDSVRDKKGGVFLSTLYSYSEHGDPFKCSLMKSSLSKCLIPIRDMIVEWICDGQIRDSHEEVFKLKNFKKSFSVNFIFLSFLSALIKQCQMIAYGKKGIS